MARRRESNGSPSGRLRIVSGKWRSRLLPVADVPGLRPTSGRIRETLFNWLAPVIDGARCLDLFAGTGALGFEALSRGAGFVDLVERSATAAGTLRSNIALLDATAVDVHEADAYRFVTRKKEERPEPYDIVFLDPPFADGRYAELCKLLDENHWLKPGALVYLEMPREDPLPGLPDGWQVRKEKTAGGVRFALLTGAGQGSHQ